VDLVEKWRVWATLLAVVVFEKELADEKDVWELVVDKARAWMVALDRVQKESVEKWVRLVWDN
jgi:hypothetical protein